MWIADPPPPLRAQRLRHNADCDVAVIGAGITGALVTHQLLQAGRRVVLLDKRDAGRGSTAASTGLLLYQPDSSVADLTRMHGRLVAQRVHQLGRQAIRELQHLARRLGIECGLEARQTLYLASRPQDASLLRDEAKRTRDLGFVARFIPGRKLESSFHVHAPAALFAAGAAQVNAFRLTHGVMRACLQHSTFRFHPRTTVKRVREDRQGVELVTDGRHTVRAGHVVVAAGYETMQLLRSRLVRLHSTYVIASPPLAAGDLRPLRHLMWETDRPYVYLRTTADNRIVFGGEDEPFANPARRDRKLQKKTRALEKKFAALFPELAFRAKYAWTGTFADTTDGLPCIGPKKKNSRVLYALGYGGNGITFSQIAARILRDHCLARDNPDAALFGFDRLGHPG